MAKVADGIERRGKGLRIRIYWEGKEYSETDQGPGDAKHVRWAIKRRDWLLSRLKAGLPILEEDSKRLSNVANDYFDSLDVKGSTLNSYLAIWSRYWKPDFGDMTPEHITTAMVRERLSKMDVSPKTKRNAVGVLSSILRHGDINPNPCAPIRIKRGQKPPVDRYTPDEVSSLLGRLEGEQRVYFTLLAATGLRPGEALALEWSDYDGEHISVSKQVVRRKLIATTKTNVRRRVYVPQWARGALNNHATRFSGGHIFQNSLGSHHCDSDVFNIAWRNAHNRARIPYRIPYTLRHTRAAELLSQGASPALAAKQLGHSVQMFLNIYSEYLEEYSDEDIAALDGAHRPDNGQKRETP